MKHHYLESMTANEKSVLFALLHEKLSVLGLQDEVDQTVRQDDMEKLFDILSKTDIGEDNIYRVMFDINRSLNQDVTAMIRQLFTERGQEDAMTLICLYGPTVGQRVLKCAVYASKGDLKQLEQNLDLAVQDYRDVIMMGEYEKLGKKLVRIRDFST